MDTGVDLYVLGPDARAKARRFMGVSVGLAGVGLIGFLAALRSATPASQALWPVALIVTAAFVVGGSLGAASARRELASFRIALGPDVIRRVSARLAPLELTRPEVVRIVEMPPGMVLIAKNPARALVVPRTLDGYARVREVVSRWRVPEVRTSAPLLVAGVALAWVAGLTGLGLAVFAPAPSLAMLGAIVFAGLGSVLGWQLLRTRDGDPHLRRSLLVMLGMGGLAVLGRLTLLVIAGLR